MDAIIMSNWEDIPDYLKSSPLAASLQEPDAIPLEVPRQYFMTDDDLAHTLNLTGHLHDHIQTQPRNMIDTLTKLMPVVRHWKLIKPPQVVIEWAYEIHKLYHTHTPHMTKKELKIKWARINTLLYKQFNAVYVEYSDMYAFLKVLNYIVIYGKSHGLNKYFKDIILSHDNTPQKINGILEILKAYIPTHKHPNWMSLAIRSRSFELFTQLHFLGVPWNQSVYLTAVYAGPPYLAFAHEHGCPRHNESAMFRAIQTLSVESVKYMKIHDENPVWSEQCWKCLAEFKFKHLTAYDQTRMDQLIQLMMEYKCPIPNDLYYPTSTPHFICSRSSSGIYPFALFHKHRVSTTPATFVSDTPENKELCKFVIYADNVSILTYLHTQRCYTIDPTIIAYTILHDKINCLKYMCEKMCISIDFTQSDIKAAIEQLIATYSRYSTQSKILKWIHNKFPNAKIYHNQAHTYTQYSRTYTI